MVSQRKSLLLVDDNPVILKSLGKGLQTRGYELFTAQDIAEALKIIEAKDHIDFLITDYDLLGENGLVIAKMFHDKFRQNSAIAVFTSHTDLMVRKEVLDFLQENPMKNGFKLIFKPVERVAIFEWLRETEIEFQRVRDS